LSYFKKAYGYSVFIFVIMFILFYLLIDGSNGYLAYIIASFFLFPFAKVLFDWIGVYKFRQKLEKQKGATYYLHQIEIFFDAILRSEEHTSELQSRFDIVCRLLLEKKI